MVAAAIEAFFLIMFYFWSFWNFISKLFEVCSIRYLSCFLKTRLGLIVNQFFFFNPRSNKKSSNFFRERCSFLAQMCLGGGGHTFFLKRTRDTGKREKYFCFVFQRKPAKIFILFCSSKDNNCFRVKNECFLYFLFRFFVFVFVFSRFCLLWNLSGFFFQRVEQIWWGLVRVVPDLRERD